MSQIDELRRRVLLGEALSHLQKDFPVTRPLFLRLGGKLPDKGITINHPLLTSFLPSRSSFNPDTAVGTVFGDGNIHLTDSTPTFSFAHSFKQAGYFKSKCEMLGSVLSRIRLEPKKGNKDWSLHAYFSASSFFATLHNKFYTVSVPGKLNKQKDVMGEHLIDLLSPHAFAVWVMDDGKKYGTGRHMFSVSIGKQEYYDYNRFSRFVGLLSDKLSIPLRAREEKSSYEITTTPGKAAVAFDVLRDHIWPEFHYKFGVDSSECGALYRGLHWYSDWIKRRGEVCRPV